MEILPFDINSKVRAKHDYRDLCTISIDPKCAYEIDDSLSLERTQNGFRLGVHIADVAARLPIGHSLDKIAREAVQSNYDPYAPMLPRDFTRQLSLDTGQNRLARSVFFDINKDGSIAKKEFIPTTIKLDANLNYEDFSLDINNKSLKPTLEGLIQLQLLLKSNGHLPAGFFYDGEDGFSGEMIAFYMVFANTHTAHHLMNNGIKATRRSFYKKGSIVPILNNSARKLVDSKFAFYTIGNHPHEFLGLTDYMHSTSPIRRYADIMVQRQLQAMDDEKIGYLTTKSLKETINHINDKLFIIKKAI